MYCRKNGNNIKNKKSKKGNCANSPNAKAQRKGDIMKKMKKVFWFSRHEMTEEQRAALGDCEIIQCNKSINTAYDVQEEARECDILAIVAPINLQQQFLKIADGRPVIMAVNDRVLIPQENGSEDKVAFKFVKWEQLIKIEVIKKDFEI